jgi:hypothetical protein
MKTVKLIFSIALITLATTAFCQLSFSDQDLEKELIKVSYTAENSKISHKVGDVLDRFSRPERRSTMEPVVCMSFVIDQPEVVYEEVYNMESWMRHPFGSNVPEVDLSLESWMTKPFNCNFAETELPVESWMRTPFWAAESIEVETWMTTAWL